MRRVIREQEPARPSTRLSTMHEGELSTTAKHRHTDPPKLVHRIRGDLDWIVMKCLEKDRGRRYETANGLAMEIERHLKNEAIVARPPSQLYRLEKVVRRNKLAFGAAAIIMFAVVIGFVVSTSSLVREKRARQRAVAAERAAEAEKSKAQSEADKSRQIASFLQEMLNNIAAGARRHDTAFLSELLDGATNQIAKELAGQPEVQAQLKNTIGEIYYNLGDYPKAEAIFRDAVEIRRKLFGNDSTELARSLRGLALALWYEGRTAEAEAPCREALAINERHLNSNPADAAKSCHVMALVMARTGRIAEAEQMFGKALTLNAATFGSNSMAVAHENAVLVGVLIRQGRLGEAEKTARLAVESYQKLSGSDADVQFPMYMLANVLQNESRHSEAEPLFREVLAIRRRSSGNNHSETAVAMSGLATSLRLQGKFDEAASLYRECLAVRQKKVPDAWYTFYTSVMLGQSLLGLQKFSEAEPLLLSGYEGIKARQDKITQQNVLQETIESIVRLYEATGRVEQAAEWKRRAAELKSANDDIRPAAAIK
jgi:tetratricopeptide (TPR) repeat protein